MLSIACGFLINISSETGVFLVHFCAVLTYRPKACHATLNHIKWQLKYRQESRAVARKRRDAAAVVIGLKFANILYNFKSSQASKAMLQSSKHTGAKQSLAQNGHSRSRIL